MERHEITENGPVVEVPNRCYGRMELAQLYFPNICGRAAWRKLKDYMGEYPELRALLTTGRRTFLPFEVSLIFNAFGRPC